MESIFISDLLEYLDYYALRSLSQSSKTLQLVVEKICRHLLFDEKGALIPAPWFVHSLNPWIQSYNYVRKVLKINGETKQLPNFSALSRPFGYLQAISQISGLNSSEKQVLCLFSNSDLYWTSSNLNGDFGHMILLDTGVSQIAEKKYLKNGRVYNLVLAENRYISQEEDKYDSENGSINFIQKIGRNYALDCDNCLWLDYQPDDKSDNNPETQSDDKSDNNPKTQCSQSTDNKLNQHVRKFSLPGKVKQVAYYHLRYRFSSCMPRIAIVLTNTLNFLINVETSKIYNLADMFDQKADQKIISGLAEVSTIGEERFLFRTKRKEIYLFDCGKNNIHSYLYYLSTPVQGQVDKLFGQHYLSNNTLYKHNFDYFTNHFVGTFNDGAVYLFDADSESQKPSGAAYFFLNTYYGIPYSDFESFHQFMELGQLAPRGIYLDPPDVLGNQRLSWTRTQKNQETNQRPYQHRITVLVFQHPQTKKYFFPNCCYGIPTIKIYQEEKIAELDKIIPKRRNLISEQKQTLISERNEFVLLTTRIFYEKESAKTTCVDYIWQILEYRNYR